MTGFFHALKRLDTNRNHNANHRTPSDKQQTIEATEALTPSDRPQSAAQTTAPTVKHTSTSERHQKPVNALVSPSNFTLYVIRIKHKSPSQPY